MFEDTSLLLLRGGAIQLRLFESDAPIVSNVKVAKAMVIDAQSELIIPATLTTSLQPPVVGLIEALPKFSDRCHLHGACTPSCPGEHCELSFR